MSLQNQFGIAGDVSACDLVGGKTVANINDPSKLITADSTDAKIGDKLDITRITKDQVLVKNIRTGNSVKLGYGHGEWAGSSSGYLG